MELGPAPRFRTIKCRRFARGDVQRHAWPEHWINRHVALSSSAMVHKPLGLLAELTHRCPLGCPYCSNPLALDAREDELDTGDLGARVPRSGAAWRPPGAFVGRRARRAARSR